MTYKGHIENGKVVFDEPSTLADGTVVRIEVLTGTEAAIIHEESDEHETLADVLAPLIGILEGFPEDWSENHDKYLREEYRE